MNEMKSQLLEQAISIIINPSWLNMVTAQLNSGAIQVPSFTNIVITKTDLAQI